MTDDADGPMIARKAAADIQSAYRPLRKLGEAAPGTSTPRMGQTLKQRAQPGSESSNPPYDDTPPAPKPLLKPTDWSGSFGDKEGK